MVPDLPHTLVPAASCFGNVKQPFFWFILGWGANFERTGVNESKRYGSVTVQFLVLLTQKNAKNSCFFAFFCVNRTRNSDRNAPLRSLVLRAEIDSFPLCSLQKKVAGRAGPVAENPQKMAQNTTRIRRLNTIFKNQVDPLSQSPGPS